MERPVELGNKAFFTEEDIQAMRAAAEPAPVEAIVEEISVPVVGGGMLEPIVQFGLIRVRLCCQRVRRL
jgi:hypothetical protein